MTKIFGFIVELIGKLYRDIVVLCSKDNIEYLVKGGCFVYKNILPFNITIGVYKFLKKQDFYALLNNETVK